MAINFRSNTVISNLRIGPLSRGGNGGGGGGSSSEPSYLAVGAYGHNSFAGAAYVYDVSNYSTAPTKLAPSGLGGNDFFGRGIAVSSTHVVVGAYGDDDQGTDAGAAYVFDATDLSATPTKLAPSSLDNYDRFGFPLTATSNHIIIGSWGDDDQAPDAGAVYVYDATNLSATPTKLAPSGLGSSDYFGYAVAASTTHIVVGAYADDDQGSDAGAVYVFDANNLSATPTKLAPSGLDANDKFGMAVAVSTDYLVVGAFGDDDQGDTAGAAYIYDVTNLSATPTKLAPSGLEANDTFGYSVAVTNNNVVIGAYGDDDEGAGAGAAYVYDANNLSATPTKLAPSGLSNGDEFGTVVAIASNEIIISAPSDDTNGSNSGAVYVYDASNLSATPTKIEHLMAEQVIFLVTQYH